jgi:hypothetical protein
MKEFLKVWLLYAHASIVILAFLSGAFILSKFLFANYGLAILLVFAVILISFIAAATETLL